MSRNVRFLSTTSNKVDEPLKVEEAETVNIPPPPSEKVLKITIFNNYLLCIPIRCCDIISLLSSYLCLVEMVLLAHTYAKKL